MSRTIHSKRHKRLIELVIAERKKAGIRQVQLAKKLKRSQTWIARLESGDRRLDVIELIDLAEAIGFDVSNMVAAVIPGWRNINGEKMSKTRWGTGCFTSKEAALQYYAMQNIDRQGVEDKIRRGEIKIGYPPLKAGQRAVVIDDGRRYAIEEESE